jgi:proteic killer suppression protein
MINSFLNKGAEDVFNGKNTKDARKTCPKNLWKIAVRKLDQIDSIIKLEELKIPPGNRFESLSGERRMEHSIRINDQFRICFLWKDGCVNLVEIVNYH